MSDDLFGWISLLRHSSPLPCPVRTLTSNLSTGPIEGGQVTRGTPASRLQATVAPRCHQLDLTRGSAYCFWAKRKLKSEIPEVKYAARHCPRGHTCTNPQKSFVCCTITIGGLSGTRCCRQPISLKAIWKRKSVLFPSCKGRPHLGGLELKTKYVSFRPPEVAAVKMVNRPPFFDTFAATILHQDLSDSSSSVEYKYNFTARQSGFASILHPLMNAMLAFETKKRLRALKHFFECNAGNCT